MKRWFTLLLTLTILACFSFASAEEVDLAKLSDDALVSLMGRIHEEIVARGIEATATLSGGAYLAGRDIPAGSYVYTCLAAGDNWGNVTIYSEGGEGKQLFWKVVSAPEDGAEAESFFNYAQRWGSVEIGRTLQLDDLCRDNIQIARLGESGQMICRHSN